jgi:hypothetical protein
LLGIAFGSIGIVFGSERGHPGSIRSRFASVGIELATVGILLTTDGRRSGTGGSSFTTPRRWPARTETRLTRGEDRAASVVTVAALAPA